MATSTRPQGPGGRPFFVSLVSGDHVRPPSVVRNSPLALGAVGPSPPDRYVHPRRRKSQVPAKSTSGSFGSMASPEHPVERFAPWSTSAHVLPPSLVL